MAADNNELTLRVSKCDEQIAKVFGKLDHDSSRRTNRQGMASRV